MTRTVAPNWEMRSRFIAGLVDGTKISAWWPRRCAANATAAPWLPPDAAIRPASGMFSAARIRLNAPRDLNEPAYCNSSSFRATPWPRPSSPGRVEMIGVRRMYGEMRARAAPI